MSSPDVLQLAAEAAANGMGCGHVPARWVDVTFDTFDQSVSRAADAAARAARKLADAKLSGLLLSGPMGCGKTHLAAAVCNRIGGPLELAVYRAELERDEHQSPEADRAVFVAERAARLCPIWVNVPSYLGRLRRSYSDGTYDSAETVEALDSRGLLVLDDLGAEKATEWTAATLFEIVGARYDRMVSTLITSNLTARQLTSAGYGRIVSRMADEGALVEMASATDYRMRKRRSVA